MSIIRKNLMYQKGYTPYCGNENCVIIPRTFFNGSQFECPMCNWKTSFDDKFIAQYKDKWEPMLGVNND